MLSGKTTQQQRRWQSSDALVVIAFAFALYSVILVGSYWALKSASYTLEPAPGRLRDDPNNDLQRVRKILPNQPQNRTLFESTPYHHDND